MSPYVMSILLSSLSMGTIITATSTHWFLAWVGLEINTLAMVPLMSKTHHPRATEAAIKYFLTQATASALLLFATTINAWYTGEWTIYIQTTAPMIMLTAALMIKLTIFPFYFWLPDVIQGLDMLTAMILLTLQKLAPLALIMQISHQLNPTMLISMGILSIIFGGWGGLNQPQLRKIMAFSSIAHMGWMMTVLPLSPHLMLMTLIMYLLMTLSIFMMLVDTRANNINKMASTWMKTPTLMFTLMFVLMALGGLPPTSGFLPKWFILEEVVKQNMMTSATIMAISALLSLFFYLRLSYSTSLTTSPNPMNSKPFWRLKMNIYQIIPTTMVMSTMILPISPMVLAMF